MQSRWGSISHSEPNTSGRQAIPTKLLPGLSGKSTADTPWIVFTPCGSMTEPPTAKRIRLCAEAIGFECFAGKGAYTTPEKLWSSTKAGHVQGDVRIPAKRVEAHVMRARHVKAPTRLAFEAWFAPGFVGARVIDPVGKPVELLANYTYSANDIKNYGYLTEHAERYARERDLKYNDGEQILLGRYPINTATEFYVWLDDLISLFKIDYKKMAPEKKVRATDVQLIEGGDWDG